MKLADKYQPQELEKRWYDYWERRGYFYSDPDDREPYTIVIPPPNVTGVLHMGHMLNNTIQDILIRKARLEGKNACWVPGTDHASIATEAKVVKMLRERGIDKRQLTREEFLKYAWEWKEKYGGIILQQLRRLGASCDWRRTAFTMDEIRSRAVIKAFVDLYRKGKIYRKKRMVHWDPEAKTVLSNEEVIYSEEQGQLYYIRYPSVDQPDQAITIATTRPETILADTAVAVHPDDERYAHWVGKRVYVPLIRRAIPVIADTYVDPEFGTGALKITPAHDPNDFEIGQRHQLDIIDIFNDDATLNENAQLFVGMDRFEARKAVVRALKEEGHLVKVEPHTHSVGRSERTNSVVEPRLSLQWYVSMASLAEPAIRAVESGDIRFVPPSYINLYNHWMKNIRDWCISRQLWWGHRIPAWYYDDHVFVAETAEEALEQARRALHKPELQLDDLRQDEDVLDTWFSSWLWPISVFDGFNPHSRDFSYYYPTTVLVTGWDIIFLWVARMIMAGYEWTNDKPFKDVYFTGMVRDKQRRKMSKSLGNSPDPLELIDRYGADSVRFGIMSCAPAGGDLLFDEKLLEQGRNFCNKLWNALKLVKMWQPAQQAVTPEQGAIDQLAQRWFEHRKNQHLQQLQKHFQNYRLSEALIETYSFIWNDFCSWYLEMVKPPKGYKTVEQQTLENTLRFFEELMVILHPFMPFITEEIWHQLRPRGEGEDCMVATFPQGGKFDAAFLQMFDQVRDIISQVRHLRTKHGIPAKETVDLAILRTPSAESLLNTTGVIPLLQKRAQVAQVQLVDEEPADAIPFVSGTEKLFFIAALQLNVEEERNRLLKELEYARGFVESVRKKLQNEKFVQRAPAHIVERERKKLEDGLKRIQHIEESLDKLTSQAKKS